ncbi:MAG: 2-oxoacid:acceptor oxidoreductase subunit alpha [Ignavibacteria bacterium]|jgi:2-oxoglutarate ferredoxin oxidoreductase subunit alpha|nr:2-oxoacid:acceptor oxidoreductase subunit alpha [Ignavibacteria bacterium]
MAKTQRKIDELTIRFAGDSGDGMQLVGTQLSILCGKYGNGVNTFPDYPAEIRAPEGTLYGVSAYQVNLGNHPVFTHGNKIDVLVAMNASSVKVNLPNVREGGIIIVDTNGFTDKYLTLAEYPSNPLEDGTYSKYNMVKIDIKGVMEKELAGSGLSPKNLVRTKNIFSLGVVYWLLNQKYDITLKWLEKKFGKKPDVLDANVKALDRGFKYGEECSELTEQLIVSPADRQKGHYRNITGNEAAALGLVTASRLAHMPLFLGSYPITPATEILHFLSGFKRYGVRHLQAEDEIGGICSAIGAAFGGNLACTTTSGPGLSLKIEAIGYAVITELPLIIIDVQRAGPSTGIPTKMEQGDLLQAIYGRHGEAPLPVLAARSCADCYDICIEAARIATKYMTPVMVLTDGYIAQGTEPWRLPDVDKLPAFHKQFVTNPEGFEPYKRDPETLARMWALPGTPGMEHRIGGLEKQNNGNAVSSDGMNHQVMSEIRDRKISQIANDIPLLEVEGSQNGDILVVCWGSTYGAVKTAHTKMTKEGKTFSFAHLRYMNPLPRNLGEVLGNFKRILVPEVNLGQLKFILQSKFTRPMEGLNKMQGIPFKESEIEAKVLELINNK